MMDIMEAVRARHSVRRYTDRRIGDDERAQLEELAERCNKEGDLHIQLVFDHPGVFEGVLARQFDGVSNYIAIVGRRADDLEERAGYHGERLVILAQQLGLNTCWVALTMKKKRANCEIRDDEKMVCLISLGYGADQGVPHRNRPMERLCRVEGDMPDWFRNGMESAMMAPTAINQQRFLISLDGDKVSIESTGGPYSSVDLGIVRYHFELGAGTGSFTWV